jgi:hypothetical protein
MTLSAFGSLSLRERDKVRVTAPHTSFVNGTSGDAS